LTNADSTSTITLEETMNPQPEPYVGNLLAVLFGMFFLYYAVKAFFQANPNTPTDLFVIGYVENSTGTTNNIHITSVKETISAETQQLYNDCVEALRALGMKKSEATKKTKQVFSSNSVPQSVQEFLLIALKK
jgi:hypothetical protein